MEPSGNNNTEQNPSANGMRGRAAAVGEVKEAAIEAAASVNSLYEVSQGFLQRQTKERPYVVLGTAAGIGFVLGGGLASRFAGALLAVGGRMLATQVLEQSLTDQDDAEEE